MLSEKARKGRNPALERHFGLHKGIAGAGWGWLAQLDAWWDQPKRTWHQTGSALLIPVAPRSSQVLAETAFSHFSPKGVTVTVAEDVSLLLSVESQRQFCLEARAGGAEPLQYRLCVSADVAAARRHTVTAPAGAARTPPDTALLG